MIDILKVFNTLGTQRIQLSKPLLAAIAKDPDWSYQYAQYVLHGRFALGEPAIAKDPEWSYRYAQYVLHGRFALGEPAIAKDPNCSYWYARVVLKGRFELGEPEIAKAKDLYWKSNYLELLTPGEQKEFKRLSE